MNQRSQSARLRAGVQAVFLAGFVALTVLAAWKWALPVPGDVFLRLDPLAWLVGGMAARELAPHGLAVLAMLLATALMGRLFCGWLCPLGTAIDVAGALGRRRSIRPVPNLKFWILAALAAAAAAGANFAGWIDPLVMTSRALHLTVTPRPTGTPALLAWGLVLVAIGLAVCSPRFWCRALCPLGAVLSLTARWAPYRRRIGRSCAKCGQCETACPMAQSPANGSPAECLGCRRCEAACPRQSVTFGFSAGRRSTAEPTVQKQPAASRRHWLLGLGSLALGGLAGGWARIGRQDGLLRPPGVPNERHLLARCTGCGACVSVCPTRGLLPQLSFTRLDAAFTPQFLPRQGPCLPDCTACSEACSTGAIARISAEDKAAASIGVARIDRSRCLPWASGDRCTICLDACPSEYRAIELRRTGAGVFRPFVVESSCTGCGVCEHRCPLEGAAAVRVVPVHGGQPPSYASQGQ